MIRRIFRALSLFAALSLLPLSAARAEVDFEAELVRLHVVAADDTPEAQALKLEVRDAVLEAARPLLEDCASAEDAWTVLNDQLDALERAAREVAGDARAEAGVFAFPDRDYGGLTVPAGDYRAVRVVIGAGEGHNWWCVLYPTLCETGEGELYSILAEWFRSWFGSGEP